VIGKVPGYPDPADRLFGSLGLTALAVYQGAHLIRTHDTLLSPLFDGIHGEHASAVSQDSIAA
jgi:hypothetical protein